jgi:hypothetical protein
MKQVVCSILILFALASAGNAGEAKLTADLAQRLLPKAASISIDDLMDLMKNPRADAVESKSLSLVLLNLRPPQKNQEAANKEFRILGENLRVADIVEAMSISKEYGYASFIQTKYITDLTCESTAKRAEGVVTFKSEFFAGRIPYVAEATKEGWVITEFRLPQYKTKVVRGKDGVWRQEGLAGK